MNFIKILFIISVLTLSANQVFALSYKDDLPINSSYKQVSESNIFAAKLLQNYVESYEKKINSLLESYGSKSTQIIQTANTSLKKMSQSLDTIQYKSINPLIVNEVLESIVTDLKIINNRMKVYLEQERQLHQEKLIGIQNNYSKIGLKISTILDNLISSLSNSLIQKESLSKKEKEIVRSLVVIREQSNKIKNFKYQAFSSEAEMKKYFQDIISILRSEIISMKK